MKNLALHSSDERWIIPILTTSLIMQLQFSLKDWDNLLFELGSERVRLVKFSVQVSPQVRGSHFSCPYQICDAYSRFFFWKTKLKWILNLWILAKVRCSFDSFTQGQSCLQHESRNFAMSQEFYCSYKYAFPFNVMCSLMRHMSIYDCSAFTMKPTQPLGCLPLR